MQRFNDILFVATPGAEDTPAFERAVRLAESHQAGLRVVDPRPGADAPPAGAGTAVAAEHVRAALADASAETLRAYADAAAGRVEVRTETLFGVAFIEVIRAVARGGHDLVGKAAHAPETTARRLFGSLDMHLLRKCPVPLWLVKPAAAHPHRRVLAAVDFDRDADEGDADSLNRRIAEAAAAQALADFAELHVVHVWQPAYEGILRSRGVFAAENEAQRYVEAERAWHRRALDGLGNRMRGWLGEEAYAYLQPRLHLRQGNAGAVIPELAGELGADLVVMGTVGRTGIAGLLIGNTAETILDGIDASVLAIKPPGFRTPVQAEG